MPNEKKHLDLLLMKFSSVGVQKMRDDELIDLVTLLQKRVSFLESIIEMLEVSDQIKLKEVCNVS